jgi:hypothetical protein
MLKFDLTARSTGEYSLPIQCALQDVDKFGSLARCKRLSILSASVFGNEPKLIRPSPMHHSRARCEWGL